MNLKNVAVCIWSVCPGRCPHLYIQDLVGWEHAVILLSPEITGAPKGKKSFVSFFYNASFHMSDQWLFLRVVKGMFVRGRTAYITKISVQYFIINNCGFFLLTKSQTSLTFLSPAESPHSSQQSFTFPKSLKVKILPLHVSESLHDFNFHSDHMGLHDWFCNRNPARTH